VTAWGLKSLTRESFAPGNTGAFYVVQNQAKSTQRWFSIACCRNTSKGAAQVVALNVSVENIARVQKPLKSRIALTPGELGVILRCLNRLWMHAEAVLVIAFLTGVNGS
jgi:hypothetical protein